jgi:hypothetical protein
VIFNELLTDRSRDPSPGSCGLRRRCALAVGSDRGWVSAVVFAASLTALRARSSDECRVRAPISPGRGEAATACGSQIGCPLLHAANSRGGWPSPLNSELALRALCMIAVDPRITPSTGARFTSWKSSSVRIGFQRSPTSCGFDRCSRAWVAPPPQRRRRGRMSPTQLATRCAGCSGVVCPRPCRATRAWPAARDYWGARAVPGEFLSATSDSRRADRAQGSAGAKPIRSLLYWRYWSAAISRILYPEGTRGDGDASAVQGRAYHLARHRPDVELVPVHIDN